MALPSSSAPISSRTTTNTKSRDSEITNPIRRSFTGNPFMKPSITANPRGFNPITPANSPSDYPRRSSLSRESIASLRDHEEKENGKDQNYLKPSKVRSPTVSSKCTKSFMSPTISAASKINPTPKKKILSERNEVVRTSLSFSESKSPSLNSVNPPESTLGNDSKPNNSRLNKKSSDASDISNPPISKATKTVRFLLDPEVTSSSKNDSESFSETVTEEYDRVNLDPSFKISSTSPCPSTPPIKEPLDADPSLPPYDPEKNYLSPRPQFLHYRPNPRIEHYLSQDADGQQLEEIFSDTEVTDESDEVSSGETIKEEEREEQLHVSETSSIGSGKNVEEKEALSIESDDVCLDETIKEEQQVEEILVCEPGPIVSEKNFEANGLSRSHFFIRHKFTTFLLVLFVACFAILVIKSPVLDPNMYDGPSMFLKDPSEIYEFAKVNCEGLVRDFRRWSDKSLSFLSEMIFSFRGTHKLGSFKYLNLSALHDLEIDGHLVFDQRTHKEITKENEFNAQVAMYEKVVDTGAQNGEYPVFGLKNDILVEPSESYGDSMFEEQGYEEIEAFEISKEASEVHHNKPFESDEENNLPEAQEDSSEYEERTEGVSRGHSTFEPEEVNVVEANSLVEQGDDFELTSDNHSTQQQNCIINVKEHPVLTTESPEYHAIINDVKEEIGEKRLVTAFKKAEETYESLDHSESATANPSSVETMDLKVISAVVLLLIVSTVFVNARRRKNRRSNVTEQPMIHNKKGAEHNNTEVDRFAESCASEMSSYERSSSYSKRGSRGSNEADSKERKTRKNYRRESLASSSLDYSMSTGSPSYGSFTTYEKVPIKNGHGEEETITPVRRSSRIKNQVTSP